MATLPPPGSWAYGLNLALPASTVLVTINSKRVLRDFKLTAVNCAAMRNLQSAGDAANWSCILGTEHEDWFGGLVRAETIFGNGALSHLLPIDANRVIEKGDYIVCKAVNLAATAKRIALVFQGIHI